MFGKEKKFEKNEKYPLLARIKGRHFVSSSKAKKV